MGTKTISLTDEAYRRLKARKARGDSFSDVVLRLTDRRPLADFAGVLPAASVDAVRDAVRTARSAREAAEREG